MKRLQCLVACMIGASAGTASAQQSQPEQRIRVVSTDELFDKEVVASDGRLVGEVEHVLVSLSDGKIGHVVVESEMQGSNGELIGIPFESIKANLDGGDQVQLQATLEQIGKAPRLTEAELITLSTPKVMQQVAQYWAPIAGGQQGQTQQSTTAQAEPQPVEHLMIGDDEFQVIRPKATSAKMLEGLQVVSSEGKPGGEIEEMVIDLDNGYLAYALVSRGGTLGMGSTYVPVPLIAMKPTEADAMQVNVPERTLRNLRGFQNDNVPRFIKIADLERVYRQFKVKPYWTAREEMAKK